MTALAVFFLAIAVAVTSARADGVGFRDISIEVDGERLITALWYPTDAPSGQATVGPFTMAASREAPIGAGRFGLIVMSHGTGGGRLNHRDTAIRLGRRRLCRRRPRTCRRQLSRQEIQRHIGELAAAPAPAERGSGSAPRRRRFRPAHRHPAYRCHRALSRRLQRACLDRGTGRHVRPNPPLHPLP